MDNRKILARINELKSELNKLQNLVPESIEGEIQYSTNITTGKSLYDIANTALKYEKRDCCGLLEKYLYGETEDKVCALYGLRQTGKTTLIRHLILNMSSEDISKTVYIKINSDDTMAKLNFDMKKLCHQGYKYIFIDEITLMQDFIDAAAVLSDVYCAMGMKIVLSGADSLGFWFAANEELYNRVKMIPTKTFNNLMELIESEENIRLAYRNIKKNKGSKTAGADNKTILDLQKWDIDKLVSHIQRKFKNYMPQKVRRVEIPKGNGKTRPLGIPTIMDRVIQQAILQVLEPICEAKFHERNNGFRPNRSAENALAQAYKIMQLQGLHYVVDIDIKGFFDNVSHGKLLKQMWTLGVRDKRLIKIISVMLKAEVAGVGFPEKGTPQGGIISPLLSNIVLNELDWWIASQWEEMKTRHEYAITRNQNGSLNKGAKFLALKKTNLKECYIVRYADDFKIFCRNKETADKMFIATEMWLKERLDLDISEEKSKVVNLKKRYSEFLGFRMKVVRKNHKYVVSSYLTDKSMQKVFDKLLRQIKKIEKPQNEKMEHFEVEIYNSMVIGTHNYYRIATNVNIDMQKIAFRIERTFKKRLRKRLKKSVENPKQDYAYKTYGKSKQIRFIKNTAVAPIGYIRHRNPMYKPVKVNKYTEEGRNLIHKNLQRIDMSILRYMMKTPIANRSIEYNDNRLALYCAQNGKCVITGKPLEIDRMDCHHKIPLKCGGSDEYKNLILLDVDVHKLIHAVGKQTVLKYIDLIKPDYYQRDKINRLRAKIGLEPLDYYMDF